MNKVDYTNNNKHLEDTIENEFLTLIMGNQYLV